MTTRGALAATVAAAMLWIVAGAAAQLDHPKKAYLLVQTDITNPEQYAEYANRTPSIVAKYGGKYLARGGRSLTLEGPAARSRVVVLEFASLEQAQAFYNSPEYVSARQLRAGAATAQFVLVEGM